MINVSVIMPSLNVVKYIEQCLVSVIKQSLENIEILCVDAGSTDGTLEILEKYARQDKRISVIRSSIKSYGYQVNLGIKNASGKYIGIVETDDYVDSTMYEYLYNVAEENCADIAKGEWKYIVPVGEGEICIKSNTFMRGGREYENIINASEYPHIFLKDFSVWRGIYKREFLLKNNIYFNESPGAAYQDCGFTVIALSKAERIYYTDNAFYNYRYGRPGCSSVNPNVLKFAYQEWKRLLDGELDIFSLSFGDYIIERMVDSFIGEYEKSVHIQNYNFSSELVKPYYEWFSNELTRVLSNIKLPCKLNNIKKWQKLQLLLQNQKQYVKELLEEDVSCARRQHKMVERTAKKEVVIFGCGNYGLRAYEFFENNNVHIKAFCDNNSDMWGEFILKTPVIEPERATEIYNNATYIVANKKNADVMKKQLLKYGIDKENILFMNCLSNL